MSIRGVVTTRHVLRHTSLIMREFGPVAFLRCCLAIVLRRRTTFLACVTRLAPRDALTMPGADRFAVRHRVKVEAVFATGVRADRARASGSAEPQYSSRHSGIPASRGRIHGRSRRAVG